MASRSVADNASLAWRTATIDLLRDLADGETQAKRARLQPGTFEPVDRAGPAALPAAARAPLTRRRRRVRRAVGAFIGSGVVHLLIVLLLLLTPTGAKRGTPEPPSVEMIFGQNGSAGLQGTSVPQDQQGAEAPPEAASPPEALPPVEQPTPPAPEPAPPPTPTPAPPPTPAPTPTLPPPPPPQPERRATARPHERSRPTRQARRSSRSSNPFANLTDLSLAPTDVPQTPSVTRRGRGGSGSAVSLSIGPIVQGGHLSMPFSIQGGHGMTSDYQELLDDWVNRHKYYPQSAADRGHDGQVAIHVVWNRDGKVLSVQRLYSSGDTDLDDAWLGLFRGAHLPPPPPDVPGDPIEYDMIMTYQLLH